MKIEEKLNKKLLVEGNDDQHVVWSLCKRLSIDQNFEVIDSGGIDDLLKSITVRLKSSNIQTVGVILDADLNLQGRWESIRHSLISSDYQVPKELPPSGLILPAQNNKPKVGVWIMPDNTLNGMLEDFVAFLIPEEEPLKTIAQETLDKIEAEQKNLYSANHRSKALIYTLLAWQEDPGSPMGQAITKRYLSVHSPSAEAFVTWLKETFA